MDQYHFDHESYWGNIEYKQGFMHMTPKKIKKYATQLKFRVIEGNGNAVYIIGVKDNGDIMGIHNKHINNYINIMNKMCDEVEVEIESFKIITLSPNHKMMIFILKNLFDLNEIPFLLG